VRTPLGGEPNCIAHPSIDAWEQRYRTSRRSWVPVVHGERRGGRYLPKIRPILVAEGIPTSLALLPAIESGFRPAARGPTGSLGLWQFEARTARRFGLVVSRKRDDRLDPERSTRAAVRYLRKLHARYGDWPLALAAYNAGEGRVDKALARAPGATFWELAERGLLPPISRAYVPKFLALVRMVEQDRSC
jgi:membrane-bound lytic murein transglycosylase D